MSVTRIEAVRRWKSRIGFTLVELLVVIAIIALLAAIIFPVFARVRENARQATVISNLHQISAGMSLFQLDHHQYPAVLFGYAMPGYSMADALAQAKSQSTAVVSEYFPGVYPTYVNDYKVFTDPNNTVDATSATATTSVTTTPLKSDGTLDSVAKTFYKADAYDISPQITGANSISTTTYVPRYQLSWTALTVTAKNANGANYQRQMRWKTQPGDTYVTCSTYHVPYGKVIVLFESGPAKVLDTSTFLANDSTDSATAPVFWKIRP